MLADGVYLRFYDGTGTPVAALLPEAQSIKFSDELAADGGGGFDVSIFASALQTDPDLLEDGFVTFGIVLADGEAPTEVFGCELIPTSGNLGGELSERTVNVGTPGLRHLLTYAPVFPEVGGFDSNTEDARLFGWMSAQSSLWDDAADWSAPTELRVVYGVGWPDAGAQLITADTTPAVGDVHLFRSSFTLGAPTRVRIFYAADDSVRMFLDSELIAEQEQGYAQVYTYDAVLSAGPHTIAAEVTNVYPAELKFGCSVSELGSDGLPVRTFLSTDATHWKCHAVSGTRPGWTAAAIFLKVLQEAQAAGVHGVSLLTPDFTHLVDSDGVPWPALEDAKAFPVGQTSVADVVAELEELAFDVRILPDFTVQAFVNQGSDVSASVALVEGVNLLSMTYQGAPVRATRALVRSLEGWYEVTNSAGETAYGKRYIGITSGVSASNAQGARVGTAALESLARPSYTYTATFRAVTGAVPFRDFGVGDLITAPVRGGGTGALRVLSLSASTPAEVAVPVTFTAELAEP